MTPTEEDIRHWELVTRKNESVDEARTLLKQGFPVDAVALDVRRKTHPMETALNHAVISVHEEMVEMLLNHGADPNRRDESGKTPLIHTCTLGRGGRVLSLLLQHGANPHSKDEQEQPAIVLMARKGREDGVIELLKAGAEVDQTDETMGTALMAACQMHWVEVVNVLLDAGADPLRVDRGGRSAMDRCSDGPLRTRMECLVAAQTLSGNTAAARTGSPRRI